MQHYTINQKEIFEKVESLNLAIESHFITNPLSSKEAKILWNSFRMSLRSSNFLSVLALNARYTFSSHKDFKKVPQSVASFLSFLESQSFLDWGNVQQNLELIWRSSEDEE